MLMSLIDRLVGVLDAEHDAAWEDLAYQLQRLINGGVIHESVVAVNAAVHYLGISVEVTYIHDSFDAKPSGEQTIIDQIHDAAVRIHARQIAHC